MSDILLRTGSVYSDADPFATAMLTSAGTITWIGDEETAQRRAGAADEIVELAGRLVTPGFVDTGPGASPQPGAHGVVAALVPGPGARWVETADELRDLPPGVLACLDPRTLPRDDTLAQAASRGVPLAFGTALGKAVSPWHVLAHALARGLSARAAFAAHTRGGWRAVGVQAGRLQVGAEATYVVWQRCELVVQVADEQRSRWSSDARAGTPPLPALPPLEVVDDGAWLPPRAELTVVGGTLVHHGR